jgi:hypothetical protein
MDYSLEVQRTPSRIFGHFDDNRISCDDSTLRGSALHSNGEANLSTNSSIKQRTRKQCCGERIEDIVKRIVERYDRSNHSDRNIFDSRSLLA